MPWVVQRTLKAKGLFLTHLQQLSRHLALTDLIKNKSIGVVEGVLHTSVWIFE